METLREMIEANGLTIAGFAKEVGVSEEEMIKIANEEEGAEPAVLTRMKTRLGVSLDYLISGNPNPKDKGDKAMKERIIFMNEKKRRLEGKDALKKLLNDHGFELTEPILDCFYDGAKTLPQNFDDILASKLLDLDDYALFALLSEHYKPRYEGKGSFLDWKEAIRRIATDGKVVHKDLQFYRVSGFGNEATAEEFLDKTKKGILSWDDELIVASIDAGGKIRGDKGLLSGFSYDVFETVLIKEHCLKNISSKKKEAPKPMKKEAPKEETKKAPAKPIKKGKVVKEAHK